MLRVGHLYTCNAEDLMAILVVAGRISAITAIGLRRSIRQQSAVYLPSNLLFRQKASFSTASGHNCRWPRDLNWDAICRLPAAPPCEAMNGNFSCSEYELPAIADLNAEPAQRINAILEFVGKRLGDSVVGAASISAPSTWRIGPEFFPHIRRRKLNYSFVSGFRHRLGSIFCA